MSGIYIHIPFCKQACHYCDFHFSTSMGKKEAMISALKKEIRLRKDELLGESIETIYFGGGTPSVLKIDELQSILDSLCDNYTIAEDPEITLEANPDDLSIDKIKGLANSAVNRLSIGIQSFFDEDLKLMNRAHSAQEARETLLLTTKYFENISIDLIYGIPEMSNQRWQQNIDEAISFGIPHISSYALTVEPKTALANFVQKGIVPQVKDEAAEEHFAILMERMESAGFVGYEISNFGKPGFYSKNNTAYWQQKKYIGIGPSAHSYDGKRRGWNINNNPKYIKALQNDKLPIEIEELTLKDRYNEYVMTGLRTIWGVSLGYVQTEFGELFLKHLEKQSTKFLEQHLLYLDDGVLLTTKKGRFLSDGIAADLFLINL